MSTRTTNISLRTSRQKTLIGRKGIEPLIALAIEFTAQPIIPTNGTFLTVYNSIVL